MYKITIEKIDTVTKQADQWVRLLDADVYAVALEFFSL